MLLVMSVQVVGLKLAEPELPASIRMPGVAACDGLPTVFPETRTRVVALLSRVSTRSPGPLEPAMPLATKLALTTGDASVEVSAWMFLSTPRLTPEEPSTLLALTWLPWTSKLTVALPAAAVAIASAFLLRSGEPTLPLFLIEKLPWPRPVTEAVMPVPLSLVVGSPMIEFDEMSMR